MRTHYERTPEQLKLDSEAVKYLWLVIDAGKLDEVLHLPHSSQVQQLDTAPPGPQPAVVILDSIENPEK